MMETLTKKEKQEGWPEELRIPSEDEFRYGSWVIWGDAARDVLRSEGFSEARKVPRDHVCGTQCCLVGWMGVAFDGSIGPSNGCFKKAHIEFARTILRLAGHRFPRNASSYEVMLMCSTVFEHRGIRGEPNFVDHFGIMRGLSPARARKLWLDAAEHHGYDVSKFRGENK